MDAAYRPMAHKDATYRTLATEMLPIDPCWPTRTDGAYRPLLANRDATYRHLLAHKDATFRPLLAQSEATYRPLLAHKDGTYRHPATGMLPIEPCCPQGCYILNPAAHNDATYRTLATGMLLIDPWPQGCCL